MYVIYWKSWKSAKPAPIGYTVEAKTLSKGKSARAGHFRYFLVKKKLKTTYFFQTCSL